ncbi:MAG: DUF2175 domain-containing protein [Gammaproteobacteria bacterium]|nr:DUF2175 domain-containing protein [Gammaproteobacteria bacterium]
MKCIFCNQSVFGADGITVPGKGPAHQKCFQVDQALKRTFQTLDISALNDGELTDLLDLVLAEINVRKKTDEDDSIELF